MTKLIRRELLSTVALPVAAVGVLVVGAVAAGAIDAGTGIVAAAAGLLASAGYAEISRTRRALARLTDDLSHVSARLLRMEAQAVVRLAAAPPEDALSSLTGDIGLLGGAMRTLTATMTEHEREIAGIKDRLDRPAVEPAPFTERADPLVIPSLFRQPLGERAEDVEPGTGDFADGETADDEERAGREAIAAAISAGSLDLLVRPVVSLPQRRTVLLEIVARLRLADNLVLGPAELATAAARLGLQPRLDEKIVARAGALARALSAAPEGSGPLAGVPLAVAISSDSLREPPLVDRLCGLAADVPAGRVVVAAAERAWTDPVARLGLAALARRGVTLLIDGAPTLGSDPFEMAAGGVRFVRFPAADLLDAAGVVERIVHDLERCGIGIVAGGVEREADVPELIDLGVSSAEGPLFGEARAPSLTSRAPAPSAETPPPPPPAAPPSDEPRTLWSALRRAG